MEKSLILISMLMAFSVVETTAQENANIVVIRDGDIRNWAFKFSIFANESYLDNLPFKTTSTFTVPTGETTLSFRYIGQKKPWKHAEKLALNLLPGETKYVMVTQRQVPFRTAIRPLEVTEATAAKYMQPTNSTMEVANNY